MEPTVALEMAQKHVKGVRDFFYHLMVYVVVSLLFVIIDLRVTGEQAFLGLDWAYWIILFWGLGVAGHAISVVFDNYRVAKQYEQLTAQEQHTPVG